MRAAPDVVGRNTEKVAHTAKEAFFRRLLALAQHFVPELGAPKNGHLLKGVHVLNAFEGRQSGRFFLIALGQLPEVLQIRQGVLQNGSRDRRVSREGQRQTYRCFHFDKFNN